MPIMRNRKFITKNETRGKETNNNLLPNRQLAIFNEQNELAFMKLHNSVNLSRTENTAFVSSLRKNKSTSTIDENETIQNSLNEEGQSNNKAAAESHKTNRTFNSNKAGQHIEKSIIHKVKVRNSKHRNNTLGNSTKYRKSCEITSDDCRDVIEDNYPVNPVADDKSLKDQVPRASRAAMCRICHGGDSISEFGKLVSACSCRGTIGRVHVVCLETWLTESGKSRCELCSRSYAIRRVHKYGILRALTIWLLGQNSKQLMVDMLGTILMMPLAILAAWLSGTTLLNLMAQEDEMAAWPLVSSFMLSCTTLVCYYCWIVSAATRHAIGWWIWYQSQYEVKLQIHTNSQADDDH